MGYRGKLQEQERARELRARAWTLQEIADELGVAKSSVSLWVRDVEFDPSQRRSAQTGRRPRGTDHPLRRRRLQQIADLREEGRRRLGTLSDRELLLAGLGLYAGDGDKRDNQVRFANSDPRIVALFCRWLRRFFDIDESRLRVRLYLHQGLDLEAAQAHWSEATGIPVSQFRRAYRAVPDASIRRNKHEFGCAHVAYSCATTQRTILGLMDAMLAQHVRPTESQ